MKVAVEQIASANDRLMSAAATGQWVPPYPKRDLGKGRYWCAADAPENHPPDFEVRSVYRTEALALPNDARCEDCYIEIRALATELTRVAVP